MPAVLYPHRSHPRGNMRAPCARCNKIFMKTGRMCKYCFDCIRDLKMIGIKNRVMPDHLLVHCTKCNTRLKIKTGMVSVTQRMSNNKDKQRSQQLHNFCNTCWGGIVKREQLQINGLSFRQKERAAKLLGVY